MGLRSILNSDSVMYYLLGRTPMEALVEVRAQSWIQSLLYHVYARCDQLCREDVLDWPSRQSVLGAMYSTVLAFPQSDQEDTRKSLTGLHIFTSYTARCRKNKWHLLYVYFFHVGIHVSEDSDDICLEDYKMFFRVL